MKMWGCLMGITVFGSKKMLTDPSFEAKMTKNSGFCKKNRVKNVWRDKRDARGGFGIRGVGNVRICGFRVL